MNYSEVKKVTKLLQYDEDRRLAHKEFLEHGIRFYDAHGWGYIRNGIKHYS